MDPRIWGPHAWKFMHAITAVYPPAPSNEEKAAATDFFNSLKWLLPCVGCKVNYAKNLEEMPVEAHVHSRDALDTWLYRLHNEVNAKSGKPKLSKNDAQATMFLDDIRTLVANQHEKQTNTPNSSWGIREAVGIVLLVLVAYYIFKAIH